MAFRYEFIEAAARDLFHLTRHNQPLLHELVSIHIPAILKDPFKAGQPKKGDLAHVRAYNIKFKNVSYRLIYEVNHDTVRFITIGPHDQAYKKAERR